MRISIKYGQHLSAIHVGQKVLEAPISEFKQKYNDIVNRARKQTDRLERYKIIMRNLKGKDKQSVRDTMPKNLAGMFQDPIKSQN